MGPLQYSAALGKMKCEFCDSVYEVAEIEAIYAEEKERAERSADAGTEQDAFGTKEKWSKDEVKAYSCPSCGAELICEETTAAAICPYCGNTTVMQEQFQGALKPDYIIPFKVDKKDAVRALEKHYKGRPFLPSAFKSENHMEEIKGVYVPFWMFDAQAEGYAVYEATNSRVYRSGDYEVTETEYYEVHREGNLNFEKVPVDASSKMPDDYMDSIEPYDYSELKEFSNAYLSGFLADKYDVSKEECAGRANVRCEESFECALERSVAGYQTCTTLQKDTTLHQGKVHYALLPVWMLSTKWKDKTFLFAVNGQSGKMVGDFPTSWKKFWAVFAALTVSLTVLMSVILSSLEQTVQKLGTAGTFGAALAAAAVVSGIICLLLLLKMRSVQKQQRADQYTAGVLHLTKQSDRYIRTTHTRRKIEKDDAPHSPGKGHAAG